MPQLCRACRASIVWIGTEHGDRIPLDWPPVWLVDDEAGGVIAFDEGGQLHKGYTVDGPGGSIRVGVSHLTTCPALTGAGEPTGETDAG